MDKRVGETNYNKFGSKMTIINYHNSQEIDIYFEEYNWSCKTQYSTFQRGEIICPYERRFVGIGYMGEGKYNTRSKMYRTWINMLRRCYDKATQERQSYYIGCTVCDEWLNYQVFAQWYEENYYEVGNQIMALDKDILNKGNRIYSPTNCVFVPKSINSLFVKSNKIRGELPIGVVKTPSNKYHASIRMTHINGKRKVIGLGNYDTPEQAFLSYKKAKEDYIKEVAEKYKKYIPQNLYEALYKWEVDIDD